MATLKETDCTPDSGKTRTSAHVYTITLGMKGGTRQIKVAAKPRSNDEFIKIQNARKKRFRSILKGAGSIVKLMPGTPPMIKRGKVGSFSETNKRVAQIWNKAFQMAKE